MNNLLASNSISLKPSFQIQYDTMLHAQACITHLDMY